MAERADRFDKFTERARRVLTLAQEEARSDGIDANGRCELLRHIDCQPAGEVVNRSLGRGIGHHPR